MAATALLDALQSYLAAAGLSPVPKGIGVAEPANHSDLPAVVLSLDALTIPSPGLGEHTEAVSGALRAGSEIDLANPLLPGDTGFSLLSPDRRTLTLYHGGLVDKDGSDTPFAAEDIQVARNGNPFMLVTAPPASGEVSVSPADGRLLFGDPLPANGTLAASYFIGQWERRVKQLGGLLDLAVIGGDNSDAETLSNGVMSALALAPENIAGLRQLAPAAVGPVTGFAMGRALVRQRQLRWRFDYEHIVDRPESSGGVIQRIRPRIRTDSSPVEEEDIT